MIVQFYKPNKSVKGCAVSFDLNVNKGSEGFYIGLVRQSGWNDSTKTGSFKDGYKMNVKMNEIEMCAISDAIQTNREFSTVHKSDSGTTPIKFVPYMRDGVQIGFSLAIKRGEESFLFGLTFGEAGYLKEFIEWGCWKLLDATYKDRQDNFAANKGE